MSKATDVLIVHSAYNVRTVIYDGGNLTHDSESMTLLPDKVYCDYWNRAGKIVTVINLPVGIDLDLGTLDAETIERSFGISFNSVT